MVELPQPIAEYTSLLPPQRSECVLALHPFIVERHPAGAGVPEIQMPTTNWAAVAGRKNYVSVYACAREYIQPSIDRHPKVKCDPAARISATATKSVRGDLRPVPDSAFKVLSKDH